jgi:Fe-S-cluster-containing dehydrogenase component
MAKYAMVIDLTRCNGCYNCFLACKDEYCGNDHPPYSAAQPYSGQFWMRVIEKERGRYPKVKVSFTALICMQCEDAPCIQASSNSAVYRRPDNIVLIDPLKAAGQKEIVSACPYRVIFWNDEKNIPQKCTFCAHLLDKGWKQPRCVEACPTEALIFGDLENPDSLVSKVTRSQKLEDLHPEYGLKTMVHYIGLPKRFIAGSVILGDKEEEWAENIDVTLRHKAGEKSVRTGYFGDFEFEDLQLDTEYTLKIEGKGYESKVFQVRTKTDVVLGNIVLIPKAA